MLIQAKQRLRRNMSVFYASVTDLRHVAFVSEVQDTLDLWLANAGHTNSVLIGGLAMSFYAKPRYTEDMDLMFLHDHDIPIELAGFKRVRPHAFRDSGTHVEVEVATPQMFKLPQTVAQKVFDTAVDHQGLKVASLEGMIALKLFGTDTPQRFYKDMADVEALVAGKTNINMDGWELSTAHQQRLDDIIKRQTHGH